MKENVIDVLIYLFENYMDGGEPINPDPDVLRDELMEAGFPQPEISKALDWLDSLSEQHTIQPVSAPAFRIFAEEEQNKLDTECRGLLMFLEQTGILTADSRERVIDRVMAINKPSLTLEDVKWVILMVLFSQPDDDTAFSRMEDLVYEILPVYLH